MKTKIKLLGVLMLVIATAFTASAYDFEVDGIYYFKTSDMEVGVSSGRSIYSGSVTIPASVTYGDTTYSVTKIDERAFSRCTGLTSVTIPNSVTTIGGWAFGYCTGLTSVTIGNSVTNIGESAFYNCSGLTAVHITDVAAWCKIEFGDLYSNPLYYAHTLYLNGEKVTDLVIPNSVTTIGNGAFYGCTGLTSVTIPNSVTTIGASAFYSCTGLTSVTIGNSVTTIDDYAFYGCSGLASVTIPNSVTSIGYDCFPENTELLYEDGSSAVIDGVLYNKDKTILLSLIDKSLKNIVVPKSVKSISSKAFYGCSGLTSVTIPNSVTNIGDYAFGDCSGLTSVTIPNSVTTIGYAVFYRCSGLTSVTIPNSVTTIGGWAFSDCSSLTSVSIPNSVTTIGYGAFAYCSGLTSVNISNSVTTIGNNAFLFCTGLTSVTIPNSVTTIGYSAFCRCSELSTVTIGRNTAEIGDYTFSGCENLSSIYSYAGTPPTIYEHTFENDTYAKAILYVPKGCVSIYETDPLWNPFYNILEGDYNGIDDVTTDEAAREVVGYYNLQGVRSDEPWEGINIVVYSDGTHRKISY